MSMNKAQLVEMGLSEDQITKILAETKKPTKNPTLRYQPGNLKQIREVLFTKNRTVRGILDWLEDRDESELDDEGYWSGTAEELGMNVVNDKYIKTGQEPKLVVNYYLSKKDLTECGVEVQ